MADRHRGRAIALITAAGMLNFIDRSSLAIANPLIRADLGLSIAEMGLLLSAFLWSFALFQLPSGAWVDRYGPRRLIAASIVLWSMVQAACGLVTGFWGLAAARIGLGITEGPLLPGMVRVIRDCYPPTARGRPTGIGFSASKLGPAIAPALLTPLMLAFGWRWMFLITGAAGIGLGLLWYRTYRDAPDTQEASPARLEWADWRRLFRYRATWGMTIGLLGEVYMGWVYQTWLPGYLQIERHLSLPDTGWVAGIPFAFGALAPAITGFIVQSTGSFGPALLFSAGVGVVSTLIYVFVVPSTPIDPLAFQGKKKHVSASFL